jgi:DNA-binding NtrC family response regulator
MSRTCLIVEGNPEQRRSLEALIHELGVETIGVSNARQALALLEAHPVDLVLAEEYLPGPSGTMLLQSVRYHWPHVARVLISEALTLDVLVRAVNQCGVHRVLSKQMHPVELRDEVEGALNEAWLAAPDTCSALPGVEPFAATTQVRSAGERRAEQLEQPRLYAVG